MHGIGMYCRVKYAYFRMQVESQNLKTEEGIKRGAGSKFNVTQS